jgi:hypothetical protein
MRIKSDPNVGFPNFDEGIICEDGYNHLNANELTMSCNSDFEVSINTNTACVADSIFCNIT